MGGKIEKKILDKSLEASTFRSPKLKQSLY